jgi:protein-disulfide isomerase
MSQTQQEKAEAAKKEMMKKMGVGLGLIAIVVGIILIVVVAQPEPLSPEEVLNNEDAAPDPTKGGEDATVVVSEYSDFQCPACQAAYPIVKAVLEEYGDKVLFEYNDYPLRQHEYAFDAAVSGQCAFEQDTFFPYHDLLFDNQRSWSQSGSESEAQDAFRGYAEEVGLDIAAYDTCIQDTAMADRVDEDLDEGNAIGVTGTPSFFVNGEKVDTQAGFEAGLRAAIDAQLNE